MDKRLTDILTGYFRNKPVDIMKDGTLLPFAVESANRDKILIYERAA